MLSTQHTLTQPTQIIHGVGVHSGIPVNVRLYPASPDTGIVFSCVPDVQDPHSKSVVIPAHSLNVIETTRCTIFGLSDNPQYRVSTAEHLLFALFACDISNAVVAVDAVEIPILDGSSCGWVDAIMSAGRVDQERPRYAWKVHRSCVVVDPNTGGTIHLEPLQRVDRTDHVRLSFRIDYDHPIVGCQERVVDSPATDLIPVIARARTFVFDEQWDQLQNQGFLRGAQGSVMNVQLDGVGNVEDGLRWPDEFVRHKILDALGDIYTLGAPVLAWISMDRSGHALNNRLTRHLLNTPGLMSRVPILRA